MSGLRGETPSSGRRLRGAILDLGGVMTEPFLDRRDDVAPEHRQLMSFFLDDFRDVYPLPTGVHDLHLLETGRISEREFFERMCRRYAQAGHEPLSPDVAIEVVWGRKMIACGAMVDAVRQVRGAGYRTALLTNISRGAEAMWRSLIPVDELFDAVTDSSAVGLRKPDSRIYLLTCERLGLSPQECIFVDDLECNVDAAAGLGMEVLRCLDPVAAADRLVRRLLGHPAAAEPVW